MQFELRKKLVLGVETGVGYALQTKIALVLVLYQNIMGKQFGSCSEYILVNTLPLVQMIEH
jgi:hypothetical protein